jgi:hypothetical protein
VITSAPFSQLETKKPKKQNSQSVPRGAALWKVGQGLGWGSEALRGRVRGHARYQYRIHKYCCQVPPVLLSPLSLSGPSHYFPLSCPFFLKDERGYKGKVRFQFSPGI